MKIYTIPEVAKLLKCSERQIFRYLKRGKLKGSKQGKWRFTDEDVREFLKVGRSQKKK
ncbi:MAG: helix-turn-helix domain-containing protein [Candidatus Yonathbacteria bacterium]|nr:helix-turn-helix domain-containing protein [Candidatus Yonathbacteria bacterium]